jgi:hypothetical protein
MNRRVKRTDQEQPQGIYQAKGAGALCQAKQEPKKKAPIISFFISTVLGMDIFEVVTKLT